MKIILLRLIISLMITIHCAFASEKIQHNDINSNIPRLDTNIWDSVYYQYKLVNNLPYQYNKKKKKYFWNPIYPIFFYKDYLRKYQKSKNIKYLYDIEKITNALMDKSVKFNYKNKIIRTFYYEGSGDVARMFHKHYSGLTNSYYVNIFSQLYKITRNAKYKEYAIEFFNSLTVPISKGGGNV